MRKRLDMRFANGVVSAAIVAFFLVHATLGTLLGLVGFLSPFTWLVWVGVALIGVHVALSIFTSREQLTDLERPPSPRKKRHLVLKWATGGLLALVAVAHVVAIRLGGMAAVNSTVTGALLTACLAVVLAVHLCVGSKSMLKDLNISRRYKLAFRLVVCAFAAFFAISALVGAIL